MVLYFSVSQTGAELAGAGGDPPPLPPVSIVWLWTPVNFGLIVWDAGTQTHRVKKIEERYSRNALSAAGGMQER